MSDRKAMTASNPTVFLERRVIGGKRIYVVDDHHKVLAAWAEERRRLDAAPNLITLDHHTDVMEAFCCHATSEGYDDPSADEEAIRNSLTAQIDWTSDNSVLSAIDLLKHDEHIHAATMTGILNAAFCVQLSDSDGTPLVARGTGEGPVDVFVGQSGLSHEGTWTYEPAPNNIYVIPFRCAIGCEKRPYDEECRVHHAREIIETRYLDDQLARVAKIARGLGMVDIEAAPYILDIDLDVFHSSKAAQPDDTSTFYRLIRNAIAITIATEPGCVKEGWHEPALVLSAEDLLGIIMSHIETALHTGSA